MNAEIFTKFYASSEGCAVIMTRRTSYLSIRSGLFAMTAAVPPSTGPLWTGGFDLIVRFGTDLAYFESET